MFIFNVKKFYTGAELDKLIKQFQELKKSYEEITPGKTLEIVDMRTGICDAIYYKITKRNTNETQIS